MSPSKKQNNLYFAYGSNLSPTQMSTRCTHSPTSSIPVAIAFLPKWRWFICERGYANVLPPPELRVKDSPQGSKQADEIYYVPGEEDGVWGVLYYLDRTDEGVLDGFEGVDDEAPPGDNDGNGGGPGVDVRPRGQGDGDYNKWFVKAGIKRWIGDNTSTGNGDGDADADAEVDVLVYVDEERIQMGPPKEEYIGRMNRGIRECIPLGVDEGWIGDVMRRYIPEQS